MGAVFVSGNTAYLPRSQAYVDAAPDLKGRL